MTQILNRFFTLLSIFVLFTTPVFASYEFALPFGAQESSVGGAVNSSTNGATSLYFNPAGLGGSAHGTEISVNVSPYVAKSTGAFNIPTATTLTGSAVLPEGGIFARYGVTEQFGVGIGVYGAAGSGGDYQPPLDLTALGSAVKPTISSQLIDMELALGAGYQISPEFSIGAAWRISFGSASFKSVSPTLTSTLSVDGLSAAQWGGFKIGAQYKELNNKWGVGTTFRTAVPLNLANGTVSGVLLSNGQSLPSSTGSTLTTQLPLSFTLGGHYTLLPNWRFMLQYDFTQYNALQTSTLAGSLAGSAFTISIPQNWSNLNMYRFGTEVTDVLPIPIRLGYVYATKIIPDNTASVSYVAPSDYNIFALGSGASLSDKMHIDVAFSYTFGTGQGQGTPSGLGDGSYSNKYYTLHTSLAYCF